MSGLLEGEADLSRVDVSVIDRAVAMLVTTAGIDPDRLLVVGAQCRDVWSEALGYAAPERRTHDLDLGFGVDPGGVAEFAAAAARLQSAGHTGIRFVAGDLPVDLMPFGASVEDESALVRPRGGDEPFSVFGFSSVHASSAALDLPSGLRCRIASPDGLLVLKVAAWHDRVTWHNVKDGVDLAEIISWYRGSAAVEDWLWAQDTTILERVEYDPVRGSALYAGAEARALLAPAERQEWADLWTASHETLATVMHGAGRLMLSLERIEEVVAAFGAGVTGAAVIAAAD